MSTRKVDDLVRMLGADSGISKREAGRICADLDAEIGPSGTLNGTITAAGKWCGGVVGFGHDR
jgi:hypothetical protein